MNKTRARDSLAENVQSVVANRFSDHTSNSPMAIFDLESLTAFDIPYTPTAFLLTNGRCGFCTSWALEIIALTSHGPGSGHSALTL